MASQISNYAPLVYRSQAASMAPLSAQASTQTTQSTQQAAPQQTLMQSLKGLNLSQDQLNKMVTYGRVAGGAGVGGMLLGLIFPPLHALVAIGFIATMGGLAASVISDALGGKG